MATTLTPTITPGDRRDRRGRRRRRPAPRRSTTRPRGLVRDALHEHSVLFFHDQDLSEDEQLAFASTFGTVGQYPLTKMFGGTTLTSTIEDTADSPPDADGWHTDVTWVAEPPAYAVLNAKVIPERGRRHDVGEPVRGLRRAVARHAAAVLPARPCVTTRAPTSTNG